MTKQHFIIKVEIESLEEDSIAIFNDITGDYFKEMLQDDLMDFVDSVGATEVFVEIEEDLERNAVEKKENIEKGKIGEF